MKRRYILQSVKTVLLLSTLLLPSLPTQPFEAPQLSTQFESSSL